MIRSRATAFTMIELLVVITVVMLLVSLLMPGLAKARESARTAHCLSNQRGMTQILYFYLNDFADGVPMTMLTPIPNYTPLTFANLQTWTTRFVDNGYLKAFSSGVPGGANGYRPADGTLKDNRFCPGMIDNAIGMANWPLNAYSHYAMLEEASGYSSDAGENWNAGLYPLKITQIVKPSRTTFIFDAPLGGYAEDQIANNNCIQLNTYSTPNRRFYPGMNYRGAFDTTPPSYRHQNVSTNFAFFDGHAETRRYQPDDPYSAPYGTLFWGGFGPLIGPLRGLPYDG